MCDARRQRTDRKTNTRFECLALPSYSSDHRVLEGVAVVGAPHNGSDNAALAWRPHVFVLSEVGDAPYYHCKGTSTIAVREEP